MDDRAAASSGGAPGAARCGIDSVEIARIERLLAHTPREDLLRLYSAGELREAGEGAGRAASLAGRFAAKEACLKLFPRETALGRLEPADFSVARDGYGAPAVTCSPRAEAVLALHRVGRIALSITHDRVGASAVAIAEPCATEAPLLGRLLYHLLPVRRRIVLENLRRVFGATADGAEIVRLAQAHYAHLGRLAWEFLTFRLRPAASRLAMVRVEGVDALERALDQGRGALVLTGHFGNWEIATVAGIGNYPDARCRFWVVRRPIKPRWLDEWVNRRMRRAGLGVFPKRDALEAVLAALSAGEAIVFPFDQYAGGADGIEVEFFGHPARTFRSLALIALSTGSPVVPAASWREPGGRHVVRFEEALPAIEAEDAREAIRLQTRAYNAALERLVLRHPEQWYWVHRRWKRLSARRGRRR